MFNFKTRIKNPICWVQILVAFLLTALSYNMMQPQDLTTWNGLFNVIKGVFMNPYLLGLCVWNMWSVINDPTSKGVWDSEHTLSYNTPIANAKQTRGDKK